MAATTKIWSNGVAPTCEDDDLNGFKSENNNLIVGAGIALNTADNQQTHKAVAHYAGVGDFYVDSGSANTYVLSVTGTQVAPPVYANGMRIRFVPGNTNTSASTVNVAGLGVKNLVFPNGTALLADVLLAGEEYTASYDGTAFVIRMQGQPILIDEPVQFLLAITIGGINWTTFDLGAFGPTSAFIDAGAKKVILKSRAQINSDVTVGAIGTTVYHGVAKSGKSGAPAISDLYAHLTNALTLDKPPTAAATQYNARHMAEVTVSLNAGTLQYASWWSSTASINLAQYDLFLVGYYV